MNYLDMIILGLTLTWCFKVMGLRLLFPNHFFRPWVATYCNRIFP